MPGISTSKTSIPFSRGGSQSWESYWATRKPSTLALMNTGYPEGIKLDWLNAGVGYDGTSIERSVDGVTYAEIDTVASGVLTYTDSTAVFQTLYYYRVRSYKGTNYSPYSNTESLEVTSDRFIITVDTTKEGSAADTFVLPTAEAGYNAYVDWGDGGAEQNITDTPGNVSHTYASQGTYQIKIRGTFPRIYFNNGGDKLKIISINNWGNIIWSSMINAFYGCSNMSGIWKDVPNLSIVTTILGMFRNANKMILDIQPFNTSNVQSFFAFLYLASNYRGSLAGLEINSITGANLMCGHTINVIGTNNYDATLISWASQAITYSRTSIVWAMIGSEYGAGLVDSGTTDGVSAGKLIQSGQNFITTVTVGDVVRNITDGTYAFVTAIDSDTQLSISVDIMANAEAYEILHSDAAKARAQLVIPTASGGQGWTITDGGPL
jgi:hypothetical protein